jgi:3D (Asp-Asp-Asp) domain-containing protein
MKKLILLMIAWFVLYVLALIWVSMVPSEGLLHQHQEPIITYEISQYEYVELVDEVPEWLFEDPEVVMEVNIATPSQAIEEKAKGVKYIEEHTPKMVYFGNMATTGYLATGNPCADGCYPVAGWTVACNDRRLWHKTIYIEGVGTRYVHDTGGMPVNVLDVFVGSIGEAYAMTNNSRAVYVIE